MQVQCEDTIGSIMLRLLALNFFICLSKATLANRGFKISVVSSQDSGNNPVLFEHGESPVWDPDSQSLYFVDVHEQNVHRFDYRTGQIYTKHIGYGQINVVTLISGSRRLLVAVRSALYLLDWDVAGDAALRLLITVDHGLPDNVINEGKADAMGRYWAGTKGPQTGDDVHPDKAMFFSIEQSNFINPITRIKPVSLSNGLTWAINNSLLYYIDSSTQKIEAFDFDLMKGEISGRRTILDITNFGYDDAIPDGMTIDSEGHLWVAINFGGTVLHIDPDARKIVYRYKLPVSQVLSVAWGGPLMDELFVTTGKDNLYVEPLAGAIFTIRDTGRRGIPMHSFKFDNVDLY